MYIVQVSFCVMLEKLDLIFQFTSLVLLMIYGQQITIV